MVALAPAPTPTPTPSPTPNAAPAPAPTDAQDHVAVAGVSPENAAKALRLGWMMAEVRGRVRPDGPAVGTRAQGTEPGKTLLLAEADERSSVERQVEAVKVLAGAAVAIDADCKVKSLTGQAPSNLGDAETATQRLQFLVSRLIYTRNPHDDVCATLNAPAMLAGEAQIGADAWWDRLSTFIWAWDENIQDTLAAGPFGTASAYELGRGLSEAYWALDAKPNAPYSQSWNFLLGANRVVTLTRLCDRLKPTIGTLTAIAVDNSVKQWGEVAKNPSDFEDPSAALAKQTRTWRDLLVTGRDPKTLVEPGALARASRRIGPVISAFRWELVSATAAAVLLGLSLYYQSRLFGPAGSILGGLGVTATALTARAKLMLQAAGKRLDSLMHQQVVSDAVLVLPKRLSKAARTNGTGGSN